MAIDRVVTDAQRKRWNDARARMNLVDLDSDDFATGGLARLAPGVRVRFVVLPAEPDRWLCDFDDGFWTWWDQSRSAPTVGNRSVWWHDARPTSAAAICYRWDRDRNTWTDYLALHRDGGLEVGLGRAGYIDRNDRRCFYLMAVVGRIWMALDLYREVVSHFPVEGPWEVSLALRGTKDAYLGNLAAGWQEPQVTNDPWDEAPICIEDNLLRTSEVMEWPNDADDVKHLAFRFGGFIEDAWGTRRRRFLDSSGVFDTKGFA